MTCRKECAFHCETPPAPAEPPVGTWVKDRFGGVSKRFVYDGTDGWAPPGCYPFAKWEPMWEARGPLVECGPWGANLTDGNPELWR